jgi:hypothetical protein
MIMILKMLFHLLFNKNLSRVTTNKNTFNLRHTIMYHNGINIDTNLSTRLKNSQEKIMLYDYFNLEKHIMSTVQNHIFK